MLYLKLFMLKAIAQSKYNFICVNTDNIFSVQPFFCTSQ